MLRSLWESPTIQFDPNSLQLNALSAATYKLSADFLFEIPDLAAEGWLRRVQLLLGGDRQTASIGYGDEIAEMPELHHNLLYPPHVGRGANLQSLSQAG